MLLELSSDVLRGCSDRFLPILLPFLSLIFFSPFSATAEAPLTNFLCDILGLKVKIVLLAPNPRFSDAARPCHCRQMSQGTAERSQERGLAVERGEGKEVDQGSCALAEN